MLIMYLHARSGNVKCMHIITLCIGQSSPRAHFTAMIYYTPLEKEMFKIQLTIIFDRDAEYIMERLFLQRDYFWKGSFSDKSTVDLVTLDDHISLEVPTKSGDWMLTITGSGGSIMKVKLCQKCIREGMQ